MLGPAETEGQTTEGCRGKGESSSRCPGYCRVAQCRSNPNASTVVSDVKYIASDSSKKGATNISKSILEISNYQATEENDKNICGPEDTKSQTEDAKAFHFASSRIMKNWTQHSILRTKTLSKRRMPGTQNGLGQGDGPNEFWSQLTS